MCNLILIHTVCSFVTYFGRNVGISNILSLAVFGENLRYNYSLGIVIVIIMVGIGAGCHPCHHHAKTLTFCNILVITVDIYLKLGKMCLLFKEKSIVSREIIQNAFSSELFPLFSLTKKLRHLVIGLITEDINLKLRICVCYRKSNPYFQGR